MARKLGIVVLALAALGLGYLLRGWLAPAPSEAPVIAGGVQEGGEPKEEAVVEVQWWTCAMHPHIRQPKPGRCPICAMELVPVAQDTGKKTAGLRQLTVTPGARALMDIQTSAVERRYVTAEVRMVGKVDYDETRLGYLTAWVPGRLDRLYVDYTGIEVKKGDHMVYLYSPELFSAQQELLEAVKAAKEIERSDLEIMRETSAATVVAAREKLRLWGITQEQIQEIERRGTPADHMTIYAPMGGIVIHKNAQEGMYVDTGTRIYTIADLSTVWVKLDAYESDLVWLRYGQKVNFTTEASPGEGFTGMVVFIDPILDERTRTVKVRLNVPNPDRKLKPGMFVRAVAQANVAMAGRVMDPDLAGKWICYMHPEVVSDGAGDCTICGMPLVRTQELGYVSAAEVETSKPLVIPASATLITGTRAIVYVEVPGTDNPTYEGREVVLGARAGDYYIVRHGLREGELVVSHGNFKIDSALQIQAKPSMMTPEGGVGATMHQHGGDAAPKPASDGGPARTVAAPSVVLEGLRRIDGAYREVASALKVKDLARINEAYAELGKTVEAVPAELLSGHPRMLWEELAMLLGNDAFEGREAEELSEAEQVFALLERHVQRLRGQFGLAGEHAGHAALAAADEPGAPREFQEQLGKVWQAYLSLHEGLAGDDLEGSTQAVKETAQALAAVDPPAGGLLDHEAHMAWMKLLPQLRSPLDAMKRAGDIDGLRQHFDQLSAALWATLQSFGKRPAGPVHKLHCPMAFEGRGADWLQADQDTLNPYFGDAMLKCGSVVDTLTAAPTEEPDGPEQEGNGSGHEGSAPK